MVSGLKTDLQEGRHEDAEKFLSCLFNGLDIEMKKLLSLVKINCTEINDCDHVITVTTNYLETDNDDKELQNIGDKNKDCVMERTDCVNTPVNDIFGGLLKSTTGDFIAEKK